MSSSAVADQMPVKRVAGQFHVLAHAVQLDALDIHLAGNHRHDVATEVRLQRIFRRLYLDVAGQQPHLATLVHPKSDLAEVHVLQRLGQCNGIAVN